MSLKSSLFRKLLPNLGATIWRNILNIKLLCFPRCVPELPLSHLPNLLNFTYVFKCYHQKCTKRSLPFFYYNSSISSSVFVSFAPLKNRINTPQRTHKLCDFMHLICIPTLPSVVTFKFYTY